MRGLGLLRFAAIGLLLSSSALSSAAQDYPNKPIRVVLTYTAGGVSEGVVRLLAPKMEDLLGQKLIIEAKPGAAGNIGVVEVAMLSADCFPANGPEVRSTAAV